MSARWGQLYRTALPATLLLLGGWFLTALFSCQSRNTTVPEELIGVWVMSRGIPPKNPGAERYADRFFEIGQEHLIFATGDGGSERYVIWNIEQVPPEEDEKRILYRIYYLSATGDEYLLAFYYNPTGDGEIVFANQDYMVWTREEK